MSDEPEEVLRYASDLIDDSADDRETLEFIEEIRKCGKTACEFLAKVK